jgi:integrase
MAFDDFVSNLYDTTYLPLLSSSTRDSYNGVISKYLKPEFSGVPLRDLTRLTVQRYFSSMAGTVPYPTISKIRDTLSSILRSAVNADYLIKNPLEGLRLPLDKRPRQPKATITPEQFHALLELIPEPYASILFVSVWTGLRVSELIGLKWRCIHDDSITIEERFCRGDWSTPKTSASAATIGVASQVIARINRLKSLTVEVRAGRAVRRHKLVKSSEPGDLVVQSVQAGKPMNDQNVFEKAHKTRSQEIRAACELAMSAYLSRDMVGSSGSRPEIGAGSNATLAHFDHDGDLRANRSVGATPSTRTAFGLRQ